MLYDVRHRTTLSYEQVVSISHHVLHLEPRDTPKQRRLQFDLHVEPAPTQQSSSMDFFGNCVRYLALQEPHQRLVVESRSRIDVAPRDGPVDLPSSPAWESVAASLVAADVAVLDPLQFAFASPYVALDREARDYALPSFSGGRPILEAAMNLTSRIFEDFEYQGGVSDVSTPVRQVLKMRKGVCQDFAHLEIACLRSIGLAARYVSGYLLTHPPPGRPKLVGSDASHAWLSVWAGELGWIDLDPTNNVIPDVEHITLAWGRDYGDVSPMNGFIIGGGTHSVTVGVDVTPVAI
ncbi:MAG TPA: transglutaminase family protein [Gammaproteobacteria bacterium]|nr:transglutaminase family protein [Gammaproteobacteria bacterium]